MRFLKRRNQEFQWGEEESTKLQRRKCFKYFKWFFLDDEKFKIGDFVLIRNDELTDPEDEMNCYVGQIKELYDTGDEFEPHQAKVQWFSHTSEIPAKAQKEIGCHYEREVVEENRPQWSDVIDAETIFDKCVVVFLPVTANFAEMESVFSENDVPAFFCRYKYLGRLLVPILSSKDTINSLSKPDSSKKSKHNLRGANNSDQDQYCIISQPSQYPKVLLKKLDDKLVSPLKDSKVVAADDIIDDISKLMLDNLKINKTASPKKCQPIIHKLSLTDQKGEEKSIIDISSTAYNSNGKAEKLSSQPKINTPVKAKRISSIIDSPAKISKRMQCNSDDLVKLSLIKSIKSPKRETVVHSNSKKHINSSSKQTPKKLLTNGSSKSPKVSTPHSLRKSQRILSATPSKKVVDFKTDILTESTPSRRSSRIKTNTSSKKNVDSLSHEVLFISDSPMKLEEKIAKRNTPKKEANNVSPIKKTQSARRSIQFSLNEEEFKTRSGRKVKPVNYSLQLGMQEEETRPILSTHKLAKFIRSNYSDESDSGSAFSGRESSSSDDEDLHDESYVTKKSRPSSVKKPTERTPSKRKKILDISIPERRTPLKVAENPLEESRLRLHVSAVPKSLPCREDEFSDIYSFVKSCLCAHTGGCMYISGVPGTGKTATVREVVRSLQEESQDDEVPTFTFVEVNGMWMTDPYQCYVHIFKSLTGKTIASQQAANLLEKRFTESGPKKEAVVLLVDELDRLWTRKQTVMYNIFDWPSKKHSKLVVLAIANTMDLPERMLMNRVSSRLGLTRKTFQPYNFKQLQQIIMSRIEELKVFDPDAVQFVARKVAAVSGDARRALDICRHATEVAEKNLTASPRKKHRVTVGMEHVDEAIQQMFSSPVIAAVKSCSKIAKIFLQCMLSEFTRTGTEETTLYKVSTHLLATCNFEGVKCPSSTEIFRVCSQLASCHLILVDDFQNDLYMKLRLSVSPDDVGYALSAKAS